MIFDGAFSLSTVHKPRSNLKTPRGGESAPCRLKCEGTAAKLMKWAEREEGVPETQALAELGQHGVVWKYRRC